MSIEKFNKFLFGFIPGLLLPPLFIWLYLNQFYPGDSSIQEILKTIFPTALMGKLLMLSVMPNLVLVFVFYKQDSFKLATGFMISGILYLIPSFFML
ncbi:MAG: hypothetical protein PHH37_01855 [Paludibacter sp.]|nr:hypothetical protein [Paludibacter sp.]